MQEMPDTSSIPGLGRSPGGENAHPLKYSCLGNPMDRRAWWATAHGISKSWTWLSDWAHARANTHTHTHTHTHKYRTAEAMSELEYWLRTLHIFTRKHYYSITSHIICRICLFNLRYTYYEVKWRQSLCQLFATPWTVAYKAPLSMEFSRQEYWSGLPFPSPGDPPDPGVKPRFKPRSPALQADALPSEPPGEPTHTYYMEKEMSTHSSILVWRIPWTEEPGGLLSMGLHSIGHEWNDLVCMHALEKEMATHSSILAWRIPGTEEPDGVCLWGHTECNTTEET